MLCLSRKVNEQIVIYDKEKVLSVLHIYKIKGNTVGVALSSTGDVKISRREIFGRRDDQHDLDEAILKDLDNKVTELNQSKREGN
jgi:carbon storage regulator CsrA